MVRAYAYMCSTRAYSEPVRHHVPTHEKVLVCLRAHAMRGGHLSRVVSLLPPARTSDECVTTLHYYYYSSTSTTKRGPRAIHILAGRPRVVGCGAGAVEEEERGLSPLIVVS